MRELRCIVFSENELIVAILDRRRRVREPLPEGKVTSVSFNRGSGGVETVLHFRSDQGVESKLSLQEAEATAALVQFCMNRKIPMPAESEKYLYVIRDSVTLMITMNFNRPSRMVEGGQSRKDDLLTVLAGAVKPRPPQGRPR